MRYTMDQYQADAQRTKSRSKHRETLPAIAADPKMADLFHAVIGKVTEAAEMLDVFKKHIFYGKPLDLVNLREEFGDDLWYTSIGLDALDSDFASEMQRNIAKLRQRYPEKFTAEAALNRNLEAERKILETNG